MLNQINILLGGGNIIRKLSSIFLAAILMLAASSTAQVARCETEQVSANVTPLTYTGTVPISGDLNPPQYPSKWYGPWGGAGSSILLIQVQVHWTPTSCGLALIFYDVNTGWYFDYPTGGLAYGGSLMYNFFVPSGKVLDRWEVGIVDGTNGVWMHFYGVIYVVYL
jgi:hypothetical protein